MNAHLIFYVKDQEKSTEFYSHVLALEPSLHVAGMTEFTLNQGCVLGLMPEKGIKRLLGDVLPDPKSASGVPRAELYIKVDNPIQYHSRAIKKGAKELSGPAQRSWGDVAAYSLDPDGHVIVFAKSK